MNGLQFYYIGFDNVLKKFYISHSNLSASFSPEGMDAQTIHMAHALLLLWVLVIAALVAERIFMAAAVYRAGKASGMKKLTYWTAATGVLGWLPVVVFFAVCRMLYTKKAVCDTCGSVTSVAVPYPHAAHLRLWAVLGAVASVLAFILYNYTASYTFGLYAIQAIPAWIRNFPF